MKLKPKFKGYSEAQLLVLASKDINAMDSILVRAFQILHDFIQEKNLEKEEIKKARVDFSMLVQKYHQFISNVSFKKKTPRTKYKKMTVENRIFLFTAMSRLVSQMGELIEKSGLELPPENTEQFNYCMSEISRIGENAKYVFTK